MRPVRLAVLGAGMIGRQHVDAIAAADGAELAAVADPSDAGWLLAEAAGVSWFADAATLLAQDPPDAVIVATPNHLHVEHGMLAVRAGLPTLVEKPIAASVEAATHLVEAAETAGVPLLVGHHRRHNPLIQAAKRAIGSGAVGSVVAVHGQCWFHKPADYFDVPWRTRKGAGPVFLNLIHDVDLLRFLLGEVDTVQAMESGARRGHAVEDTAVILLRFADGALGTVSVSDAVAAPWSWELTSGENPAYPRTEESCYQIGGTEGSLSLPQLDLWRHHPSPHWWNPIERERLSRGAGNPLVRQILNLCAVARGEAEPVVPGREGLATLRVIEAVKRSAASGLPVQP